MRKTNKLYTANKWNQPLFADVDREHQNIFDGEDTSAMVNSSAARWDRLASQTYGSNYGDTGFTLDDYQNSTGNNWFGMSKKNNWFSKGNIGNTMQGIGTGAAIAGSVIKTGDPRGMWDTLDPVYHLAGGRESKAGNAMSDAGVSLAKTGNPWLMLAGAGLKVVGGLTNAAFGLKTDTYMRDQIRQNINDFSASFGAKTLDDIHGFGALGNPTNVYKGGWFSGGKAKKKNEDLTFSFNNALSFAERGQQNTVDNMWREKLHDELADWHAFGGPLGAPVYGNTGMGAIDYGFMSDYLTAKNKQMENKNTASNPFAGVANNFFSDGGGIEIKHPGRLTELKKRTGKTEAELWAEGRPEVRKMITFARNARKWKKAYGGFLNAADTLTDAENNIFEIGGPKGKKSKEKNEDLDNLAWYLSQRMKYPEGRNRTGFERFLNNDLGISERTTEPWFTSENQPMIPMVTPEEKIQGVIDATNKIVRGIGSGTKKKVSQGEPYIPHVKFAFGGDMQTNGADYPTGLTHINAGGSHEESPYDGVQLGTDSEGKPNLVEENETIFNDYVYSNRIVADAETLKKFHLPKKAQLTYADITKRLEKEIKERPNDPISQASFQAQMESLAEQQERQKQEMEAQKAQEAFDSLTPEEKVGVMQYAQQQEAQQIAMQEQAMQQQAMQEQPSPEEMAMMEQQQMMPQEGMAAYGGNLFADGGAVRYLKSKYPKMSADSLNKMATILEKRAAERLADKRSGKAYRTPTEKDYATVFKELDSINSNRRFNNWVNAGLSREAAFDISYEKPPKSFGQSELDKWNAKRAELTKEPERRMVYKNPLNGKTFATKAEANADVKAYREAQKQQPAQPQTAQTAQSFVDNRGWKHSTQEDAEKANARYAKQNQQNSTGTYVDDRGWKHSTQQAAEAANKRYAQQAQPAQPATQATQETVTKAPTIRNTSKSAQPASSSQRTAPRQSSKNMGVWKEGVSNQWDTYTRPGLEAYLTDLEEKYNNAGSEEEKDAIRNAAMNEFNNLQQSYYDYVLPGVGNTPTGYSSDVENHQRMFENMKGNTGFWGVGDDGSITNRIENDIDMPTGHHTTDTPAGHGIDGYNGPRTSIRNFGSTEYGGDDYYAPYVERFNNLGLTYSPMQKWRYGDDLGKSLYGLSIGESYPEDATNFGDYNPDYEDEDTFEVVDENGNPTGVKASSEEAVEGVPGTTTTVDTNPTPKHKADWMRYAGLFGPAVGLGMQMAGIGKPDYSSLDAAVNGSGNAYLANWMPIGNYLRYEPMDIWFEQNRLNANARATDRAILNSGANQGAKAASLLASGYNNQVASGDLYRKAREYNDAQKYQIAGFNRGTDQFNAEAFNRNSQFNADALNRARQFNRSLAMQAANQKLASDAGWYNGIYGNVAGLFKGLSELGRENAQYNWLSNLAADGVFGNLGTSYTGQRYIEDKNKKNTTAKGGKLKKKGLTF